MFPRTITWSGGEHNFLLNIEHLRALQEICNAGPEEIVFRLLHKRWLIDDVTATIRLALEGGGQSKVDAKRLVKLHIEDNLAGSVVLAQVLLQRAIYGDPEEAEDLPKEEQAEAVTPNTGLREKTENGISATSINGAE